VLSSAETDVFVEAVAAEHPMRSLYTEATAQAMARCGRVTTSPHEAAARVYRNFIWTHFVCKLLIAASPADAFTLASTHLDLTHALNALGPGEAAVLSGFHYAGYPLVALGFAASPLAPLISKARVDVIEKGDSKELGAHVVYLSDRSAPLRLTRALKEGRSVWVMLDVVLPSVRGVQVDFLGRPMRVGAGLGTMVRLSGRPCMPIFWQVHSGRAEVAAGPAVRADGRSDQQIIQEFVDTQAAIVSSHPEQWLEWYSVLPESQRLRAQVKRGNDQMWARLSQFLLPDGRTAAPRDKD
jgi:hypothetical protein